MGPHSANTNERGLGAYIAPANWVLLGLAACIAVGASACYEAPPPVAPDAISENAVVQLPPEPATGERAPRVVRRLISESREQVAKNRQMVTELADPRGRDRANAEARDIENELDTLAARIVDTSSDNLDDVMAKLQLLDTRIDILHDRLRAATLRTSAVSKD